MSFQFDDSTKDFFIQQYDIFVESEPLFSGTNCTVHGGFDHQHDRNVAIKFFVGNDAQARLEREQSLPAWLANHAGLLHAYSSGDYRQTPYLVLPLVKTTFAKRLRIEGPFSPRDFASFVFRLANLVTIMHEGESEEGQVTSPLIHADLKPANIFFNADK